MHHTKQTSCEENVSAFKNLKIKTPQHWWTNGKSGFVCVQKTEGGKNSWQPVYFTWIWWCWKYSSLISGVLVASFPMFCLIKKITEGRLNLFCVNNQKVCFWVATKRCRTVNNTKETLPFPLPHNACFYRRNLFNLGIVFFCVCSPKYDWKYSCLWDERLTETLLSCSS